MRFMSFAVALVVGLVANLLVPQQVQAGGYVGTTVFRTGVGDVVTVQSAPIGYGFDPLLDVAPVPYAPRAVVFRDPGVFVAPQRVFFRDPGVFVAPQRVFFRDPVVVVNVGRGRVRVIR